MKGQALNPRKTSFGTVGAAPGRGAEENAKGMPPAHDEIVARAKTIWQAKGCPVGRDEEIRLEAERELRAEAGVSRFSGKDWVGFHEEDEGRVLVIHASGKLSRADYARFVPEMERLISRHGSISLLFEMHDFHGWEAGAMWEDGKFALRHFSDVKRLAMVGETKWQKAMSLLSKPFTRAQVRYFEHADIIAAHQWVKGEPAA